MYLSNGDLGQGIDAGDNVHAQQSDVATAKTNESQSSPASYSALLVIDDNTSSEDSTNEAIQPPSKTATVANTQAPHIQVPSAIPPSTIDHLNSTVHEQRRRNSSIAKLLGGKPLKNQQYEEISQQLLDAQSAHHANTCNEHGTDSRNQRTRSSITRTLLMNNSRSNSMKGLLTTVPKALSSSSSSSAPSHSKPFEYLIRGEPDKTDVEHTASALQRHDSGSKVDHHSNSSHQPTASPSISSTSKRKKSLLKASTISSNKPTANVPPFALRDPFELQSLPSSPPSIVHYSQKKAIHEHMTKRPRNLEQEQAFSSMNYSRTNQSPMSIGKINESTSAFYQFSINQDPLSSRAFPYYSEPSKLLLPSPIMGLSPFGPASGGSSNLGPMRNAKSASTRPGVYEIPRQRSYSNPSNDVNAVLAASSESTVPLKKRLIHAYNNSQYPGQ